MKNISCTFLIIIIILNFIIYFTFAIPNRNVQLCGKDLTNFRIKVCEGKTFRNKRSRNYLFFLYKIFIYFFNVSDYNEIIANYRKIRHYKFRFRRQPGEIVNECCRKPCLISTLMNYCD